MKFTNLTFSNNFTILRFGMSGRYGSLAFLEASREGLKCRKPFDSFCYTCYNIKLLLMFEGFQISGLSLIKIQNFMICTGNQHYISFQFHFGSCRVNLSEFSGVPLCFLFKNALFCYLHLLVYCIVHSGPS